MAGIALTPARVVQRPPLADSVLALVLAAGAQIELWAGGMQGPRGANMLAALLTTLPLAWRTVAPLPVVAITTGAFAAAVALGVPEDEPLVAGLAPMLALYSLGARAAARAIAAGLGFAIAAGLVAALTDPGDGGLVIQLPAVVAALAVGRAVRELGFETDELEARTSRLERERDQKARAAVADERARIARELHDVIGHSISVMGIQAGAVRRRLAPEQEREREALLAVERVGRDTVDEMRRLLGILRADAGGSGATNAPLERLGDLVADMRRAGLHVELTRDGSFDDLSAGRALAVLRIAQEALTNVLRHAPGARVDVALRRTAGAVEIDVADDGAGRVATVAAGGDGHGLVGMRERVALYGGSLRAGPRPGSGFRVLARVPVGE